MCGLVEHSVRSVKVVFDTGRMGTDLDRKAGLSGQVISSREVLLENSETHSVRCGEKRGYSSD